MISRSEEPSKSAAQRVEPELRSTITLANASALGAATSVLGQLATWKRLPAKWMRLFCKKTQFKSFMLVTS